ncbi:MAG: TetR/AcrR family transcriptional regulator [Chitinophagales bacterium]
MTNTVNTKRNKSQKAVLQSAKTLFWKHGIRRVTVEEICKEAEVSKMTFYRNFNNKNEVAQQILEDLANEGFEQYQAIMRQEIPFPEKVTQLIELKHETSDGISQEFVSDIYEHNHSELQDKLTQYHQRSMNELKKDLENAQREGWIRQDLKISFVLYMINALNDKMLDKELTAMYDTPTDLIMELTKFCFYGMSPMNEN